MDVDAVWDEATPAEPRALVEDLVDAVVIHPDHLQVVVNGAPPLTVTLAEVGLRDAGTKKVCRRNEQIDSHWRIERWESAA